MAEPQVQTSSGLLVDENRRILLGLRASWKRISPDLWDAIGGHVEEGESIEAALIRELREEVGIHATGFHWIASLPEPRPDLYGESLHHVFAVTAWEGVPSNVCDEHSEVRWFTAAEVALLKNTTDFDFPDLMAQATSCPPDRKPLPLPTPSSAKYDGQALCGTQPDAAYEAAASAAERLKPTAEFTKPSLS